MVEIRGAVIVWKWKITLHAHKFSLVNAFIRSCSILETLTSALNIQNQYFSTNSFLTLTINLSLARLVDASSAVFRFMLLPNALSFSIESTSILCWRKWHCFVCGIQQMFDENSQTSRNSARFLANTKTWMRREQLVWGAIKANNKKIPHIYIKQFAISCLSRLSSRLKLLRNVRYWF